MKKILYIILAVIALIITINLFITSEIDYSVGELKNYCKQHSLSQRYAVIVDFGKHSGTHRLFVIDLDKNEVIARSLCAHGAGGSTALTPSFSNVIGSNSSCLGHFKITAKSKMNYRDMDIVNNICKYGIYPIPLPVHRLISSGCFAIDAGTMEIIGNLMEQETLPILLYAYYE